MLKKKLLVLNASILLGIGSLLSTQGVSAESISDLKKNQATVQEKKSAVESDISNTKETITEMGQNVVSEIKMLPLLVT